MKITILVVAGLVGLVAAGTCPFGHGKGKGTEPKGFEYHAPGPEDRRSPCIGLNNLANHGFLPRSGKDITIDQVRFAVSRGFNYEPSTFDFAFNQAVDFKLTTTGNPQTFHLDDLKAHDEIEFDGSLSRDDFYFGDQLHFSPKIWAGVAKNLGLDKMGPGKMDRYVTVETAAKARAARVAEAKARNPAFNASAAEVQGSPGTLGLLLVTLWDDEVGAVRKDFIKSWVEEERIPFIEGFGPTRTRNGTDISEMFERILAVKV
ncbi:Chloroperoxidase [Echria macrotheca]|uniref:Chloroperoxidase n=1 Tax=Echria macrotheca TaxID=438768 RepID=A0AAJ0B8N0_9PEZI|nr:Chloroperoxidase [Echria macrotheca]